MASNGLGFKTEFHYCPSDRDGELLYLNVPAAGDLATLRVTLDGHEIPCRVRVTNGCIIFDPPLSVRRGQVIAFESQPQT